MVTAIGSALSSVITWVGTVVTAFVGEDGDLEALLPLLAIGIAVSVFFMCVKAIRSLTFGA